MAQRTEGLGIIGAGRVGTALARLALGVGYKVNIATRSPPDSLQFLVGFTAPGAEAMALPALMGADGMVVLAIPAAQVLKLDPAPFAGKVVIDATNYWQSTDGRVEEFEQGDSSSEVIRRHLSGAHIVKTLNHIGYHEMETNARPANTPDRQALAVAGDDAPARARSASLLDAIGFDPVEVGLLDRAWLLEPIGPIFGRRLNAEQMGDLVAQHQKIGLTT